jgi:hypothetical protein
MKMIVWEITYEFRLTLQYVHMKSLCREVSLESRCIQRGRKLLLHLCEALLRNFVAVITFSS